MTQTNPKQDLRQWKSIEKISFRFFFVYFLILILPLNWIFFQDLGDIVAGSVHYSDIFHLSRYTTSFFSDIPSFADWGIAAIIGLVVTLVWTLLEKKERDYNYWHYILRVILRYRLALAVIAYGFIKLFPLQAPYPSISHLNTTYGAISTWKLFSLSLGIVPSYESFLGFVELFAGILLLFKRTTTIGAFIIISFTGNVVFSNLAYEGGELVYSLFLVSIALFLVAYDLPRLYNLLVVERPTIPNYYKPVFATAKSRNARFFLKSAFIFSCVFLFGYLTYVGYKNGTGQFPNTPGLVNASGIYNVKTFSVEGDTLQYSQRHPQRWKDVVFEEWNTLSVRSNIPVKAANSNVTYIAANEAERNYEFEGIGDRHYYSYEIDNDQNKIILQNRNPQHLGDKLYLHYERPNDKSIILNGSDHNGRKLYVELEKIDKKYLLKEAAEKGRRGKLAL
ncbi:hypothetical protein U1E44_01965 [Arenibacter sp. GZD96]|uniref:hypothetical protein n=1 Tax=Aurantibrevibacter litoralis TaxID=3106030 RepID=UPI002AFF46DA|nr:hypothetical protein [Arenibacter sp. GZD-96]MEA1784845.1 hypothetical protein [Arenibacter sp. GZD-96]